LLVKPKTLSCSPSGFRQVLRWTTLHEFQLDMQQQYQPWCREVNAWRKHVILICLTIGGYPVTPKVHYIYIWLVVSTPLKNITVVSWDDYSQYMEK
jgi:hypothetical protein